jgi:hypothetical protein
MPIAHAAHDRAVILLGRTAHAFQRRRTTCHALGKGQRLIEIDHDMRIVQRQPA